MGAFNSAKSQAASSTTPGLAVGGTVTGAGSIMVGENGPEILAAQPGATVTPLTKANAATITTPQSQSPTINNDALGKVIGEHVANAFRQTPIQTNLDGVAVSRGLQAPMGQATRKI
jgi:hypothetical protein